MKTRTQIQLDREEHEALKAWAHRHGLSMSAAVRWLIRSHLMGKGRDRGRERMLSACGAIRGRKGQASVDHDRYLYGDRSR